jgi:hypothetical protein
MSESGRVVRIRPDTGLRVRRHGDGHASHAASAQAACCAGAGSGREEHERLSATAAVAMRVDVQTRFVTKYRHVDGKLELKVTDDRVVRDRPSPNMLGRPALPSSVGSECSEGCCFRWMLTFTQPSAVEARVG